MKIFDKFLKLLKTDRNTFCTFILFLCTFYILVDRLTEYLMIVFTGVGFEYWGPISYAIAFVFPVFAFNFGISSKFIKHDKNKLTMFYAYVISLYLLALCMITEWINQACWLGILALPNYTNFIQECSQLVTSALSAVALSFPFYTVPKLFKKLYSGVNDTKLLIKSVYDYSGINLSDSKIGWGPYTAEIFLGHEKKEGGSVKIPEIRRYESTLVVGISGSGKTSLIFEPWVAQDIDKKFFYRETSKTLAIAALKTGIATLSAPYDNDYINTNFTLSMLVPSESKKALYNSYFKKMILSDSSSNIVYRDLGITYMSPDYETIGKIKEVCDNFGLGYNLIDPNNPESIGLNPFAFDEPIQTALSISSILKGFYADKNPETEIAYRENISNQMVENLAILLKVMYPRLNNGKLPNINDMLQLLNNFTLIEKMCRILEQDNQLSAKYESQINYFKQNFYTNSPNRQEMQKQATFPASQLDSLLRYPGVKKILCNRVRNINYDDVLKNGQICLVCTRRGDLGENAHKAFGLYYLLLMQFSVLRRPGNESNRIPHCLYIDEFPDFICRSTETIFTVYRKYRIATVVSAQNLSQLRAHGSKLGDTIIANCSNKIVFGNNSPEDNEWWSKEIGQKKEWDLQFNGYDAGQDKYIKKGTAELAFKPKYKPGKIQAMGFKRCAYKVKDLSNKNVNGMAILDFMPSKFNNRQKIKMFDFTKFSSEVNDEEARKYKFFKIRNSTNSFLNSHMSMSDDFVQEDGNPIKMSNSDLSFDINNGDAITFTFDKGKKSN